MKTNIKLPILALILLLAVGCSNDEGIKSPIASSSDQASTTQDLISYDGLLIQLPEGFEAVSVPAATNLDGPRNGRGRGNGGGNGGSMSCVTQTVNRSWGGLVHYNWTGCLIPPGVLPQQSMDIQVCVDPVLAICEFAPHPTQFNGNVWIRIDFTYLALDLDEIDLEEDIAIFYVRDDGSLLIMPHWVDWSLSALVGTTDHFSRYIVTRRVGS